MNPHDLANVLDKKGYWIDDDTGEVSMSIDTTLEEEKPTDLLVLLAATGQLELRYDSLNDPKFFLKNWKCYESMEEYCKVHPHEPQCKTYDT